MKNNILIIAIVTFVAIAVIVAVILASVLNSSKPPDSSNDSSGYSTESSDYPESPGTSDAPSDDSSDYTSSYEQSDPSSSESTDSSDTSDVGGSEAEGIIAAANSLIGVPFAENGSDPDGFDNSGFIYYVLRENGYITCPRGTEAQSRMGTRLGYDEIKEGDLVFFSDEGSDEVSFGGIYVGDGKMIACLMPGTLVREVDITTQYYRSNFFGGVSLT